MPKLSCCPNDTERVCPGKCDQIKLPEEGVLGFFRETEPTECAPIHPGVKSVSHVSCVAKWVLYHSHHLGSHPHIHTQEKIYSKKLDHMITEPEKSRGLHSASWSLSRPDIWLQPESSVGEPGKLVWIPAPKPAGLRANKSPWFHGTLKAGKGPCSRSMDRQWELFGIFLLLRSSPDWTSLTHSKEDPLLFTQSMDLNVNLNCKHPHRHPQNGIWPVVWAPAAQSCWHISSSITEYLYFNLMETNCFGKPEAESRTVR